VRYTPSSSPTDDTVGGNRSVDNQPVISTHLVSATVETETLSERYRSDRPLEVRC